MKRLYLLITAFAILITACSRASDVSQEDIIAPQQEKETIEIVATERAVEEEILSVESIEYGAEIIGGDEESLRKFLIYEVDGVYGSSPWRTVVTINSLPNNLPVEIPVSDRIEVIGSIARATQNVVEKHNFYTIFLESDLSLNEAQELYAELLEHKDWMAKFMPDFEVHGFAPDQSNHKVSIYCSNENKAVLEVNMFEISENITSLRLDLNTEPEPGQCTDMNEMGEFDPVPGIYKLFPALRAPNDAIVEDAGEARASFGKAETISQINTTLAMETLLEHYNNQLENANWEMISQTHDDETAWSRWSFKDDEGETWRGFFIIYDMSPENDSLQLSLQIFRGE